MLFAKIIQIDAAPLSMLRRQSSVSSLQISGGLELTEIKATRYSNFCCSTLSLASKKK